MSAFVGSQNVKAGGNSVGNTFDLTPGFSTKFGIIWWSGRTESTDANGGLSGTSIRYGVCFFDSATSRRLAAQHDENGAAAMDCDSKAKDDCVVLEIAATGTEGGRLDISAIGSTTITFIIDAAFTVDIRFHLWCIDTATNTYIADRLSPTGTGAETCTGTNGSNNPSSAISFTGAVMFYIGWGQSSSINSLSADSRFIFGWAISGTVQGLVAGGNDDAAMTSLTFGYGTDQECFCVPNATNGFVGRADFDQFNTDGWQMNWIAVPGTQRRYCYAIVKGGQWKMGNNVTSTTLDATITLDTAGFTPRSLIVFSQCHAESTAGTTQGTQIMSFGAATSATLRNAQGIYSSNNAADALTSSIVEYDEVYAHGQANAIPIRGLADINTWADPIVLIMDDGDDSNAWFSYLIHGDAAGGGATPPRRLPLLGVGTVIAGGLKLLFDFREGKRWWKGVWSLLAVPWGWFRG